MARSPFAVFVALVLAVVAAASPSFAGNVLRLGAGVQTLHALPQDAIDAASDGDVLLFEAGTYPGFTVAGRSLSLVALAGGIVQIDGAVEVRGLASAQRVVLSGFLMRGPADVVSSTPTHALWLRNNAGLVVVQDCTLEGNHCGSSWQGGYALRATNSARAALLDCTLRGGTNGGCGTYWMFDGGQGLHATASTLVLHATDVIGGSGEDSDGTFSNLGGDGATGVYLTGSQLFAAGSTFRGGTGGDSDSIFDPSGNGADGLWIDTSSSAHLLDVIAVGGGFGWGWGGYAGQGIVNHGVLVQHSGSARFLGAPRFAAEDTAVPVTLDGESGDHVWAATALSTGWRLAPGLAGVWLVPYPAKLTFAPLAVLPSGGGASASLPAHGVTSAVGASDQFAELYVLGASGGAWLGGGRAILRLDRDAAPDCDGDGEFDVLSILEGASDCNGDWKLDVCQIATGELPDCNANGVPDACDLASGTSSDANQNGVPDECETTSVWHVDDDAAPGGDGSAGAPFQSLGSAFDAAISGDEIVVADGFYAGGANRELDFAGRALDVHSVGGAATTVLDAQSLGRIFLLSGGESAGTRIAGFTLRHGVGPGAYPLTGGGAISAYQASFSLLDCRFEDCLAGGPSNVVDGGAVNAVESTVLVDGCRFVGNATTLGLGGGLSLRDCMASIVRRSHFEQNESRRGGGLHVWDSEVVVAQCTFFANVAPWPSLGEGGGAAYVLNFARPTSFVDCLFAGNSTQSDGGALNLSTEATPVRVDACTFTQNSAASDGGALAGFNAVLTNSVLWGDSAPSGSELQVYGGPFTQAHLWVDACLVAGGQAGVAFGNNGVLHWGSGNVANDPIFVDPDGGDDDPLTFGDNVYRLDLGSPALDAGNNLLVPQDPADLDGDGDANETLPLDLTGKARFRDIPSAPDVGVGAPPLVDLGCFERQS